MNPSFTHTQPPPPHKNTYQWNKILACTCSSERYHDYFVHIHPQQLGLTSQPGDGEPGAHVAPLPAASAPLLHQHVHQRGHGWCVPHGPQSWVSRPHIHLHPTKKKSIFHNYRTGEWQALRWNGTGQHIFIACRILKQGDTILISYETIFKGYYLETDPDPIAMVIRVELFIHTPSKMNTNWHYMVTPAWLCYSWPTGDFCLQGLWMDSLTLITMAIGSGSVWRLPPEEFGKSPFWQYSQNFLLIICFFISIKKKKCRYISEVSFCPPSIYIVIPSLTR